MRRAHRRQSRACQNRDKPEFASELPSSGHGSGHVNLGRSSELRRPSRCGRDGPGNRVRGGRWREALRAPDASWRPSRSQSGEPPVVMVAADLSALTRAGRQMWRDRIAAGSALISKLASAANRARRRCERGRDRPHVTVTGGATRTKAIVTVVIPRGDPDVAIGIVRFDSDQMPKQSCVRCMLSGQLTSPTHMTARTAAERTGVCLEAIFRIVRTIQKPVVGVTALSNSHQSRECLIEGDRAFWFEVS